MLTKTCNCERAAIFLWYCLLISWFSVHVRQACVITLLLCPSTVDAIVLSGKAFHSTWIKRKKTLRFGSKYFILKIYGKPLINSKLHVGMERAFYSTWQQSSYRSLKTWKVLEFYGSFPWSEKSWILIKWSWKVVESDWKLILLKKTETKKEIPQTNFCNWHNNFGCFCWAMSCPEICQDLQSLLTKNREEC